MTIRLRATHSHSLPRLGWLAAIDFPAGEIRVVCGDGVEAGDGFVVEGVWDGPFHEGGFHRASHFYGSGLRIDEERVFVVPSHALVDRVLLARRGDLTFASNSLLLMLAATGDVLDPGRDYRSICNAIIAGVRNYDPMIPHGAAGTAPFRQGYRVPQIVDRNGCSREDLPAPRKFNSFDGYYRALILALENIVDNAGATARRNGITGFTSTSTGYDSAAVSSLAIEFGVTRCFTTFGGRNLDGAVLEDGRPVAEALGLEALELKPQIPDRWQERLLLAATPDGRESLYASMLERFAAQQDVTCLWSGYHGDKLWDRATSGRYLEENIYRGDMSGFNLGEARLDAGFINLCIPFMFATSVRDIVKISNLAEMADWQVGGGYDRPIPRRIAELHGVPRELFGQKKSVIMEYYTYCRNPDLAKEFRQYLAREQGFGTVDRLWYELAEKLDYWRARIPALSAIFPRQWSARETMRPGAANLANTLYVWAVNSATDVYARKCAVEMAGMGK